MSKKIFCLLIALLMLLTISCASAAEELDNSTLETVDEQEAVQSTIDDASLEIENDDADAEVLSDIADSNGTADSGFHIEIDVDDEYGGITITGEAYSPARGAVYINITNTSGKVVESDFSTLENSRYVFGGLGFNLPKGEYAVNYHYYGDDIFAPRTGTEYFTVDKDVAGFDVKAYVNKYGAIIINATLNKAATGNVTFRIVREGEDPDPSKDVNVTVENGTAIFNELTSFENGKYTVYATYSGDGNYYKAYSGPMGVDVNKTFITPTYSVNVTDNAVDFTVDLGVPATGTITATFPDGQTRNWVIHSYDTKATYMDFYNFRNMHGNISVVLDYDGDDNYYGFYEFYVDFFMKYNPDLNVNTVVDEYGRIKIYANVNESATGDVTFRIKNATTNETVDEYTTDVDGGRADYNRDRIFAIGHYNIEVEYGGSDTFNGEKNDLTVADITKEVPVIEIETAKVTEYGAIFVKGNISEIRNGNVTFIFMNVDTVKNMTVDVPIDENGTFEYDELEAFEKGFYRVSIEYAGNDTYYGAIEIRYLDVEKTAPVIEIISADVDKLGAIVVKANITKGATGNVTFYFFNLDTGKNFTVPIEIDENGTIEYDELEAFEKGYYNVQIGYAGDDNYYSIAENVQTDVNVTKIAPSLTYTVNVVGGEVTIAVTLPSDINGNLTVIYPSGHVENVTIKNGTASIHAVFMKETGEMGITALFAGNDKYYAAVGIIDFIIKQATLVKATSVSVVYQNSAKVTVKLSNLVTNAAIAGAPVEITVNGKTYKGTTDKNGNAVITIPAKMLPKKYTAKVVYKGTERLMGDVDECTFTVKKATPKVTAKKKTFKKSVKVKKYAITLKDNKGKAIKKAKVAIKVGKKTFSAKTDAKGKAVFKLKKLTKKAKYTAKVTYKGDKYFNKVTKKVKITIK